MGRMTNSQKRFLNDAKRGQDNNGTHNLDYFTQLIQSKMSLSWLSKLIFRQSNVNIYKLVINIETSVDFNK